MKKWIIGLAAIGAVVALRPLLKRKAQTMREHCEQMAGKCREKMAQFGGEGERGQMRQRCGEKMAEGTTGTPSEEAAVAEPPEPATTPVGNRGEALAAG